MIPVADAIGKFLLNAPSLETVPLRQALLAFVTTINHLYPGIWASSTLSFEVFPIVETVKGYHWCIDAALAAYSNYIMSTRSFEPLWHLGAWDYLSDILYLMHVYHLPKKETSALVACQAIYGALSHLLEYGDDNTSKLNCRQCTYWC
ncbi:hypothetical protein ID866_604 [Astraeus odoratus]|nr:hypothetical protein ID866_604 [Astraeus odoratus]